VLRLSSQRPGRPREHGGLASSSFAHFLITETASETPVAAPDGIYVIPVYGLRFPEVCIGCVLLSPYITPRLAMGEYGGGSMGQVTIVQRRESGGCTGFWSPGNRKLAVHPRRGNGFCKAPARFELLSECQHFPNVLVLFRPPPNRLNFSGSLRCSGSVGSAHKEPRNGAGRAFIWFSSALTQRAAQAVP
jgi:hypothetical protein